MSLHTMCRDLLAVCAVAGCATGHSSVEPADADSDPHLDATRQPDAPTLSPPPDAGPCHVMTRELLANPPFDLNPTGTGWVEQNINNTYPIITADDGIAEQSPP